MAIISKILNASLILVFLVLTISALLVHQINIPSKYATEGIHISFPSNFFLAITPLCFSIIIFLDYFKSTRSRRKLKKALLAIGLGSLIAALLTT